MTNTTTTTSYVTATGEVYSATEYAQLCEARDRRAALPKTPLAPQSGITAESKAASEKRRNAPLQSNQGFSLLK
jgi:hypothetical protein